MKMTLFNKLLILTIISIGFICVRAQAQSLDSTLAKYANNYQQEKTYLHYDKSSYAPGETIWFKAYLMEGLFPADDSKTFYVDWIADNGDVLWHTVSPVVDAVSTGQFDIPSTYTGNVIHVRAYTRWMLNFDTAFLYSKDIHIINKTVNTPKTKLISTPSIQFFPEGGDAVAGVSNRIAFEATDQWGRPVMVRGLVVDNKGAVVDSFRSVHDGMGSFLLFPKEGASYSAKWKDEKGAEHTTALPGIKPPGISMQVMQSGNKRLINLNCSQLAQNDNKTFHIIGTMNQTMVFKTDAGVQPGNSVRRIIPTESLPTGILTITVFDDNWNAVAERITFVNNHDYSFQPTMEVQHWGLNKRARNEVEITLPDSLQANLSVSVTDNAIEKDTSDNIISHLLLTADIKGHVNNPAYYFSSDADSVVQNLDLVLLTHGWRRFKWEDVTRGKLPKITYPKDTAYLSLSGQVFGVTKSQLSGNDNIVLVIKSKDSGSKMEIVPIDRSGIFNDQNFVFFDTLNVYYQLKSKFFSQAEAKFMLDRLPAPNYSAFSRTFNQSSSLFGDTTGSNRHATLASEAARLRDAQQGKILETVTVTAKTKTPLQKMDDKYASGLFKGSDSYNFDLVNDPASNAYPNIFSYLQGKVAGLQITTTGSSASMTWRGSTPQLYLDEVPTDVDMISSIPVSDVAYVKVFRPPFFGGVGGGSGGAIAIYTRKGNDTKTTPGKGLSSSTIAGYTPIKQFYSPNYDHFDQKNEQKDIRTTLYWNPMIVTNPQNHTVKLTFYNTDVTKSFRVVIEGMTKEGLLTHYEQVME
jgi:hypothetical protein